MLFEAGPRNNLLTAMLVSFVVWWFVLAEKTDDAIRGDETVIALIHPDRLGDNHSPACAKYLFLPGD